MPGANAARRVGEKRYSFSIELPGAATVSENQVSFVGIARLGRHVVRARVERALSPQDRATACSLENTGSRGAPQLLDRLLLQHR